MSMMLLKRSSLTLSRMMRPAVLTAIRFSFSLWSHVLLVFCCWGRPPVSTRSQTSFSISMDFVRLAHCAQLLKPISFFLFAEVEVEVLSEVITLLFLKDIGVKW